MFDDVTEFLAWFEQRQQANAYEVDRVPLAATEGWSIDPGSGDVAHRSGRFYTIQGLSVESDNTSVASWNQPIIVQPEIGILGILITYVGGTVYCLLQAKMEPGNVNLLQLSPTVQATRSNYMRVHQGNAVPYLEHFQKGHQGRVVFDALQSEQGSWFLDKRNRNMIVEIDHPVPAGDDFCWVSLDLVHQLLQRHNLVNMDTRTVLSGLTLLGVGRVVDGEGRFSTNELLSWFTDMKARHTLDRKLAPLSGLPDWKQTHDEISHVDGAYFSIIGVDVRASSREVARWAQPMLAPTGTGMVAFVGRHIRGRFHVLVRAGTQAGTHDVVELAPTVRCTPSNHLSERPQYLDLVERAEPKQRLVDVVHSEEGGRFFGAENRYLVVDAGEEVDTEDVPEEFRWMTVDQLVGFLRYGNHVSVEARCLLACMDGRRFATVHL